LLQQILNKEWDDILFSICIFKFKNKNREFYFCIDLRDCYESDPKIGKGYHLPLLEMVKYYFKVNYNIDAIQADPNLKINKNKILPIFPFFPVRTTKIFPYLPSKTILREMGIWTSLDQIKRIKNLYNILSLKQMKRMRNYRKDFDIFFVMNYYHNEVHQIDNEYRYQLMKEILKSSKNTIVGFTSNDKIPGKFGELQLKRYSLKEHLTNLARSKVGIYVRGVHNCISFKFGQFLCLGLPIVGQTICNNPNIMKFNFFKEQFSINDPVEIVQKANELLSMPEKMIAVGQSNANVFDNHFTPQAVVSDMLNLIVGSNEQ
jgi:hypothetical protein